MRAASTSRSRAARTSRPPLPATSGSRAGWYGTRDTPGNTGFGSDVTRSHEVAAAGDTGYPVGGAVVQTIEGYATELYGQLRWFTLDRDEAPGVEDVVVGTLGTRVKF
jgi:hypothetical protein